MKPRVMSLVVFTALVGYLCGYFSLENKINPILSFIGIFAIALGAGSVEYVMPLLQDLELSAGALMGLGRAGMAINQTSSNPKWSQVFSNVY